MPVALFGITNDALNLVVNLLILFLVVVWFALIAWTYFDARRRIEDPFLVACATARSLSSRSSARSSTRSCARRSSSTTSASASSRSAPPELRVRQLEEQSCPNCEHPIERTYLRCPSCRARIKDPCESCGKPIDPRWSICPYCETPVRRAAPPERRGAAEAPGQADAGPSRAERRAAAAPSAGRKPAASRHRSRAAPSAAPRPRRRRAQPDEPAPTREPQDRARGPPSSAPARARPTQRE